jgi:hypothetical protein
MKIINLQMIMTIICDLPWPERNFIIYLRYFTQFAITERAAKPASTQMKCMQTSSRSVNDALGVRDNGGADTAKLNLVNVNQAKAFIIIGHQRSGTTALARLLNASSHVACLYYEGNLLYRLWRMLSRWRIFEEPHEDLAADFKITATYN